MGSLILIPNARSAWLTHGPATHLHEHGAADAVRAARVGHELVARALVAERVSAGLAHVACARGIQAWSGRVAVCLVFD